MGAWKKKGLPSQQKAEKGKLAKKSAVGEKA
jgi:hypothetical protein